MKSHHRRAFHSINIDFDGKQVTLTSNVSSILDAMHDIYERVIVKRVTASAGKIVVSARKRGFLLRTPSGTSLVGDSPNDLPSYLKHVVHMAFVDARPDLLWVHAGAVEREGRALLLCGRSGQGKSTLSTMMGASGWRVLSDDVAPVSPGTNKVLPFYQLPTRRIAASRHLDSAEISALPRETVRLPESLDGGVPARVAVILFLEFVHGGRAELTRVAPGSASLELLRNTVNFGRGKDATVAHAAELARNLPAYALSYGRPRDTLSILTALL